MLDVSSSNYGTYYDITIPEPESPVTIDWGSCIAMNTAKITKALFNSGTTPVGSMGTYEVTMTIANFQDFPFCKIYSVQKNTSPTVWTDYEFVGTGNNLSVVSNALETRIDIDRFTYGTLRLTVGTYTIAGVPTAWNLIQYGK